MVGLGGHLFFSAALGAALGFLGYHQLNFEPATAILAAVLCTIGGLLPDLDRDASGPVGEVFCVFAAAMTILLIHRFEHWNLSGEEKVLALVGAFIVIRYGIAYTIKKVCVSQGMFHSIPAAAIVGLAVYLGYRNPDNQQRLFMTAAVVIGFLSHLVLDQFGSVKVPNIGKEASKVTSGGAMKFFSKSKSATAACYSLLGGLGFLTNLDVKNEAELKAKLKENAAAIVDTLRDKLDLKTERGGVPALPVSRERGETSITPIRRFEEERNRLHEERESSIRRNR